jgi:hypothetical protein
MNDREKSEAEVRQETDEVEINLLDYLIVLGKRKVGLEETFRASRR